MYVCYYFSTDIYMYVCYYFSTDIYMYVVIILVQIYTCMLLLF